MTDDQDAPLLASLEQKLQLVRDRVQGVAEGYHTGFYLWGEGGTSKSYTVEETLKALGTPYKLTNTQTTPRGLFDALRDFPDVVHVIEDCETMFNNERMFGILRSALWGQAGPDGKQERGVCWQTANGREEFLFTGGVIIIANCRLDDIPQARALKTRLACLHYAPTNAEVAALMRHIAGKGHTFGPHRLTPEECREVADAIIDRSARLTRNLDLRLLVNTYQDVLQFKNGAAETHWRDLLDSRMAERVTPPVHPVGMRARRNAQEAEVAGRIAHLPVAERLAAWQAETGKSRAEMYRALRMVSSPPSQSQVPEGSGELETGPGVNLSA